jgi:DNA polymerase III alpha subunit (gram-positive type)
MLNLFLQPWNEVPTVWIDVETTGLKIGIDRAVQVAIVRFEKGILIGQYKSLVRPEVPISAEATAIHGIKELDVENSPLIETVFMLPEVVVLLKDAQPGAYNAPFDRQFIPDFNSNWMWPWLDTMTIVRNLDRYVSGKGRHKLENACKRWDIELGDRAHDALADATATGKLFYKLVPELNSTFGKSLGEYLYWQRREEAIQWFTFNDWRARQPPIAP